MKCGGCVSTVEKLLNDSDGIENVSVNLLTESAYFEINKTHTKIDSVLENLKKNGFPSKIYINDFSKKINKSELTRKKKWNNQWQKLTFALFLLLFSGLGHLAEGGYINFADGIENDYLPFWLVDIKLSYKLYPSSIIYFEINNLLDKKYVDFGNIPQPGRWVRTGIKINL